MESAIPNRANTGVLGTGDMQPVKVLRFFRPVLVMKQEAFDVVA